MSWWRRLFGRKKESAPRVERNLPSGQPTRTIALARDEEEPPASGPAADLQRILDGQAEPSPDNLSTLFQALMNDDAAAGVEMLHRFTARFPRSFDLRLRLAEALYDRGEQEKAIEYCIQLAKDVSDVSEIHGKENTDKAHEIEMRCNYLIGDYFADQADPVRALDHYSEILAQEISYPRVRNRVEHLRKQLDLPAGMAAPTVLGAEKDDVGDRYLLQKELGRGGSGVVYLATDRIAQRPVALKVLHPNLARRAELSARLFCEARLAASLQHPQIITIFELDEQRGMLVTEYCPGGTLADYLEGGQTLALPPALKKLCDIARVLAVLHRSGIVHRDVKPSNLLQRHSTGPLVLTDFGIARALKDETPSPNRGSGSWRYMAPEQRDGSEIDFSADVYSAGIIFLEMVLGGKFTLTYTGSDQREHELHDGIWRELGQLLPEVQRNSVIECCRNMTAVNPRDRIGTGEELLELTENLYNTSSLYDANASLLRQIETRARPHQNSDAVRTWLADKRKELGC
jgi:hypothetical protein